MLEPSATTEELLGVRFAADETGWAVGGRGTILRTDYSGATWTPQSSGTTTNLSGVSFVDTNAGWAVGGTILHTTDGGATWTDQGYGGVAASFVDANLGWVVGGNTILHTADGGASWTRQSFPAVSECACFFPTQPSFSGVSFADANTGAVVGKCRGIAAHHCIDIGVLLHTSDGGNTWAYSLAAEFADALRAVSFADAQSAIGVGDSRQDLQPFFWGSTVRTTNGGASWQIGNILYRMNYSLVLNGVSYVDANTAMAVGAGGLVLRTTDGGANWTSQSSGTSYLLTAVSFVDANTGWAVGSVGTILHTTTGGE